MVVLCHSFWETLLALGGTEGLGKDLRSRVSLGVECVEERVLLLTISKSEAILSSGNLGVHNLELLGVDLGNAVSICEKLYVVSIEVRKDSFGACVSLRVRRERSFPQNTQGTR